MRVLELENEEAAHKRELEMKRIEKEDAAVVARQLSRSPEAEGVQASFSTFQNGSDEINSYLQRFERFATSNSWPKSEWATALSALMTGKGLDVYSRMPDEVAVKYDLDIIISHRGISDWNQRANYKRAVY